MGAERLFLSISGFEEVTTMDQLRELQPGRVRIGDMELFTPHLMGTARMGNDPRHSVVGLGGEVHDLPGCFVADASLFPTPIGVNPQVTIAALALRVGDRLAESMRSERAKGRGPTMSASRPMEPIATVAS